LEKITRSNSRASRAKKEKDAEKQTAVHMIDKKKKKETPFIYIDR